MLNKSLSTKEIPITETTVNTTNDTDPDNRPLQSIDNSSNISTINNLKKTAEEHLSRIQQQGRTMSSMHSNLSILMKRYNHEKSYFSIVSDWYGDTPWWCKLLLGLVLIGTGAGIGAIFNLPIVMACVVAGLYLIISGLLINHYSITDKANKRICEDIINMEKSLAASIEHLNAMEESLNKVMIAICKLNQQMADNLTQFEGQMNELALSINGYQDISRSLSTTQTSLISSSSQVNQSITDAQTQLQTSHNILSNESSALRHINHEISLTNNSLLVKSDELNQICVRFNVTTSKLSSAANSLQKAVSSFSQYIESNRIINNRRHNAQSSATEDALNTNQIDNDLLLSVDRTIANARACMAASDQSIIDQNLTAVSEEVRTSIAESRRIYDRAFILLQNRGNQTDDTNPNGGNNFH